MSAYMPYDRAMEMLLRHGVFKWFTARRKLIALKDAWRAELRSIQRSGDSCRIRTLVECREALRCVCQTSRWVAPDHDRAAQRWLASR